MSISNDLTRLANCKIEIKTAIEEKGVPVDTEQFELYPDYIRAIEGGGGGGDEWKEAVKCMISPADGIASYYPVVQPAVSEMLRTDNSIEIISPGAFYARRFDRCPEIELGYCTTIKENAFNTATALYRIQGPFVTRIESAAFQGIPQLETVSFPSCTDLYYSAFQGCHQLGAVTLSQDQPVNAHDGLIFNGDYNLQFVWAKWGDSIPDNCFDDCRSVWYIGDTSDVKHIGYGAFGNCFSITDLHLSHCESIGSYAFWQNKNLNTIYFEEVTAVPSLAGELFGEHSGASESELPQNYSIVVPDALYDEWIAATNWAQYADHIVKFSEYNA